MNQRNMLWILACVCIVLMITACVPPTPSIVEVNNTIMPPTVKVTATPTRPPDPITPTTTPTDTATPTASSTPGPTPTLTGPMPYTVTPTPNYTLADQQTFLDTMLATNGGCDFPCWWGITPGETSWQDFDDTLDSWPVVYTTIGACDDTGIRVSLLPTTDETFAYPQPGVSFKWAGDFSAVERIVISGYENTGTQLTNKYPLIVDTPYLQQFHLPAVLTQYGIPDDIKVNVHRDENGNQYAKLLVMYTSQGLVFENNGYAVGQIDDYLICTAGELSYTTRVIMTAADGTAFESYRNEHSAAPSTWYDGWQSTADPTAFYQAFSQAEPSACVRWLDRDKHTLNQPEEPQILHVSEQTALPDLLNTSACPLPCWHGITPEVTSASEAEAIFQTLSPITRISWHTNDFNSYYAETLLRFSESQVEYIVEQELVIQENLATIVRVTAKLPPWSQGSAVMQSDLQPYKLSGILQRYGMPDKVQVHLPYITCENNDQYALRLFYEDAGFIVVYKGIAQRNDDNTLTICPALEPLHEIALHMMSSEDVTEWANTPLYEGWTEPDIDEATFTGTYANPAGAGCLTLPSPSAYTCP